MNILSKIFNRQWFGKKIFIGILISLFLLNIVPVISSFLSAGENSGMHEAFALTPEEIEAKKKAAEAKAKADAKKKAAEAKVKADAKKKSDAEGVNQKAQAAYTKPGKNGGDSMKKKVSDWASLILAIFTPLIAIVVKFVGSLMGDAYIFGESGSEYPIYQLLYDLWDIVRTLVNYGFLLILLFYAVMNIIPYASENYALKTVLPRMILAIIVVNLTFFGTRVVFDVVDVAARVVFALPESLAVGTAGGDAVRKTCAIDTLSYDNRDPEQVKANNKANTGAEKKTATAKASDKLYIHGNCYPAYIKFDFNKSFSTDPTKDDDAKKGATENVAAQASIKGDEVIEVVNYGGMTIYWTDFNWERFDEGTIAPLFAFSIMQIQNLPRLAYNNVQAMNNQKINIEMNDDANGWTNLFINTIAGLIIMILVLIVFVLMLINLFFRVIILWINIIASPLMALGIAMPELSASASGAGEYLGAEAFLKHAFAPVIMGIPLVIGFIMITVGKQHSLLGLNGGLEMNGALLDGVNSIHQLFYYILTIAILWVGGVKAVEYTTSEKIKSMFINPISEGVGSLASTLAKAPMLIRFIPTGVDIDNKDGNDAISLRNLFTDLPSGIERSMRSSSDKIGSALQGSSTQAESYSDTFLNSNVGTNIFNKKPEKLKSAFENSPSIDTITRGKGEKNDKDFIKRIVNNDPISKLLNDNNVSVATVTSLIYESQKGKNAKLGADSTNLQQITSRLTSTEKKEPVKTDSSANPEVSDASKKVSQQLSQKLSEKEKLESNIKKITDIPELKRTSTQKDDLSKLQGQLKTLDSKKAEAVTSEDKEEE